MIRGGIMSQQNKGKDRIECREDTRSSEQVEPAPEDPSPDQVHAHQVREVLNHYGEGTEAAVLGYD